FADIVDETFTAQMESQLDDVEEGGDWQKLLKNFYDPFSQTLETAAKSERVKVPDVPTDIPCENCGTLMVIKSGRFGKFLACPNYPACKTTKPIVEEVGVPCPKCGAKVIKRKSKRGKVFFGCEKYPVCDYVSWDQPVLEKCAECGGDMVLKYARNKAAYHQCLNNTEHKFYLKRRKTDNSAEKTNG
ncbi:MAG: topoisomerase DNA-binding C4 zinc finger domain-containing protein, partial [Clostridia bacterium]|nr:topoisomerase DNA-binding C4 zinc finger domain-containing protein [Clostridia bacterium]